MASLSLQPAPPSAADPHPVVHHEQAPSSAARWAALLTVCLGVMMAFVNVSSTLTALSGIQDDLHCSPSQLVWISSAYSLVVVSLVMSAGTLGDLVGRRLVFIGGALVFAGASGLAFVSSSTGTVITAEALMGIGGAAVLPTSLAIVSHTFTDPHERTEAISVWASCSGLGLALGPITAGVLLRHYSWHSVFLTNVALGVAVLLLTPLLVRESKHPSRQLDPAGVVLGTLAIASAVYAIIEGASIGYTADRIVTSYVVCGLTLALFVATELRHHDPMLDLRLFAGARFATVMVTATTTMFGFVGISLLSVLYLERVKDLDALDMAVRLLTMFATYIVVSAVAARLARRFGTRLLLTLGTLVMSGGLFWMLGVGPFDGYSAMWPGLFVAGVGSGLLVAPSTAAAVNSVPPTQAGMASSAVNMFRQLGSVLGPSVLGTVVTTRFPHNLADRLAADGVPAAARRQVVEGATHGAGVSSAPAALRPVVGDAVARGFTDAFHTSLLIGAITLAVMALPIGLLVRDRRPTAAAAASAPAPAAASTAERDDAAPTGVRHRDYSWDDQVKLACAAELMRGSDFLQDCLDGRLPLPGALVTNGIGPEGFGEGSARFTLTPSEWQYNARGTVAAGVLTTLADSAMSCAVLSRLSAHERHETLELRISLTEPVTAGSGVLTADGVVVALVRGVATTEATITDATGRVVARAGGTSLVVPRT